MSNRVSIKSRIAVLVILAGVLSSCAGGGQGLDPLAVQLFNFAPGFGGVHLNSPLELTFTAPIDAFTVTPDTIRIFTTTTTQAEPDPGAPARGTFMVIGNVVRFLPNVPQSIDPATMLSDAGLRIGFTYTIQVPASPDVISPIRTIEGDPNLVSFVEFFTTLNSTILPAPGEIAAEPNLNSLPKFFIDEGIENGIDSCPRDQLPLDARDSPQVIDTDPDEGESGFGTITGIQVGLGTAFVRLDPITILFSEPIGPWRIRPQNISIRNTNLGGETFDLFFFFTQDRSESRLQITVFDADSAFDQASVPQGRYVLTLNEFSDLAGNLLINQACTAADGIFQLSFSTVSSPSLPTNLTLTFQDNDGDGHVDVGGLATANNDPNEFPDHVAPFLGGLAVSQADIPSPSNVTTTANWGDIGFWTGCEFRFDNGFDPSDPSRVIPAAVRLRGGSAFAATPIIAPIAGYGSGRSSAAGSQDGSTTVATPTLPAPPAGRVNFSLTGSSTGLLFTGDLNTGPITYHYYDFELLETGGGRPFLSARDDSVFPLLIFCENSAVIAGDIILDGEDGEFGFNGANDGSTAGFPRNPGGTGGNGKAGAGDGGDGGSSTLGVDPTLLNGASGTVPVNVISPLDQFDQAVAGLAGMVHGGGGHWDSTVLAGPNDPLGGFQGGGGAGPASSGTGGADRSFVNPGGTDQGQGGNVIGNGVDFGDPVAMAYGGAGGGGGASDDDSDSVGAQEDANDQADVRDDGGGGGGAGGGFLGFTCGGDISIGVDNTPGDPGDTDFLRANIRMVGGRGGSTYATVVEDGLGGVVPGNDPMNPDPNAGIGQGNAGGGGGGGGCCFISAGQINMVAAEIYAFGKRGGNSSFSYNAINVGLEEGGRTAGDHGGDGGSGIMMFLDIDGFEDDEIGVPYGNNTQVQLIPDPFRDLDDDGDADLDEVADFDILHDFLEMAGDQTTLSVIHDVYGDDENEIIFGTTRIVTEFFDTLSDAVSYDRVQILSNAPAFPYDDTTLTNNVMQTWVDVAGTGAAGTPDLSGEQADGSLNTGGVSIEVGSHFNSFPPQIPGDPLVGANVGVQRDSTFIIPVGIGLGNRYVRVRLIFNLANITPGATLASTLATFAPGGFPPNLVTIADDPGGAIDNTLGNIDQAPIGVPAFAEVRVRFTP